jgi:hypothetical protein
MLEDLIEHHNIGYWTYGGLYWDQGFNKKINTSIKHLFDWRLQMKKEKNTFQEVIKLIMNSAYGKTILKESNKTKKSFYIYDDESYETVVNHLVKNYNMIDKVTIDNCCDGKYYEVTHYTDISEHWTRTICGVMILSMSKRIMNEVIYTAEDNYIPIFYTDTDSMHIYDKDVLILGELIKKKYGRELIGKYLGQFHCDFNVSGYINIYSVEFVADDKKFYIDKLRGINEETGIDEQCGYHMVCKGINKESFISEVDDLVEFYRSNKTIQVDLCKGKPVFKHDNRDVFRLDKFIRTKTMRQIELVFIE